MNIRTSLIVAIATLGSSAGIPALADSFLAQNPDLYGHAVVFPPVATNDSYIKNGQKANYDYAWQDPNLMATTDADRARRVGYNYDNELNWPGKGSN
jgi:hypothetical protein